MKQLPDSEPESGSKQRKSSKPNCTQFTEADCSIQELLWLECPNLCLKKIKHFQSIAKDPTSL